MVLRPGRPGGQDSSDLRGPGEASDMLVPVRDLFPGHPFRAGPASAGFFPD